MVRRQAQPRRRHEVEEGACGGRGGLADGLHDALILMRAGDGEHVREGGADALVLDAETARDDDAAILRHGLADGIQALGLGAVEKAASVDDDDIGAVIARGDLIAFRAQPRDDALTIDQRLGAAEADEADLGSGFRCGCLCGLGSRDRFGHMRRTLSQRAMLIKLIRAAAT